MKVIFGGVRGTSPVAQPDFVEFGGETTSLLIEGSQGERLLIDAGSGIRTLGKRLSEDDASSVLLLLTHYHLDHLLGLPSLSILYDAARRLEIASPARGGLDARDVVSRLLAPPFWPIPIDRLPAGVAFSIFATAASVDAHRHGGLAIRWCPIHHPHGCTAYRIDEEATGASIVLATDFEWAESSAREKDVLRRLCAEPQPADLLILDGQFTQETYPQHRGWGHNSWVDAIEIWRAVGAGRLIVTHHDPDSADAKLREVEAEIQQVASSAELARQGMEVALRG